MKVPILTLSSALVTIYQIPHGGHLKSTFAHNFEVLLPLPPCMLLFIFEHPPPFPPIPPQGTFVLGRNHPLPLNFYTCEI